MTIDTLEYVKKLEAAGVDRRQAEAHAAAVRDTLATQLATKADIDRLQHTTKADIDRLQHTTKADIDRLQHTTKADIDRLQLTMKAEIALLDADLDSAVQRFETLLWKHTAGLIVTMVGTQVAVGAAVVGVLLRFLR